MEDKCPFCGADRIINIVGGVISFACGTDIIFNEPLDKWRHNDCFNRQIANLTERLDAWRGLYQNKTSSTKINMVLYKSAQQRLRELGEIER